MSGSAPAPASDPMPETLGDWFRLYASTALQVGANTSGPDSAAVLAAAQVVEAVRDVIEAHYASALAAPLAD